MFVSFRWTQTWRLHTKLYKFGWHTSTNSARMKNSRDLILGEVVYVAIIYYIPVSWIYLLNGYRWFLVLITRLVKTENIGLRPSQVHFALYVAERDLSGWPKFTVSIKISPLLGRFWKLTKNNFHFAAFSHFMFNTSRPGAHGIIVKYRLFTLV